MLLAIRSYAIVHVDFNASCLIRLAAGFLKFWCSPMNATGVADFRRLRADPLQYSLHRANLAL
jgi:hypothetical protein